MVFSAFPNRCLPLFLVTTVFNPFSVLFSTFSSNPFHSLSVIVLWLFQPSLSSFSSHTAVNVMWQTTHFQHAIDVVQCLFPVWVFTVWPNESGTTHLTANFHHWYHLSYHSPGPADHPAILWCVKLPSWKSAAFHFNIFCARELFIFLFVTVVWNVFVFASMMQRCSQSESPDVNWLCRLLHWHQPCCQVGPFGLCLWVLPKFILHPHSALFVFPSVFCQIPCLNGGRCIGRDVCWCPSNSTGKFCHLPVPVPARTSPHSHKDPSHTGPSSHSMYTLPLSNQQGNNRTGTWR